MIFGSIIIFSPIQDFPYSFLLNGVAEPDRQQNISFAPDIQAFRLLLGSQNWLSATKPLRHKGAEILMSLRGPKGRGNLLNHWQKGLIRLDIGFELALFFGL